MTLCSAPRSSSRVRLGGDLLRLLPRPEVSAGRRQATPASIDAVVAFHWRAGNGDLPDLDPQTRSQNAPGETPGRRIRCCGATPDRRGKDPPSQQYIPPRDPTDQCRARREWLPQHDVGLSDAPPARRNPRSRRDSGSAPGATRTPNLLIRRSPSGVRGRPVESRGPGAIGSWVRRRPLPSSRVHREWLPTWLPAGALPAMAAETLTSAAARTPGATIWVGAQIPGSCAWSFWKVLPTSDVSGPRFLSIPEGRGDPPGCSQPFSGAGCDGGKGPGSIEEGLAWSIEPDRVIPAVHDR